LKKSSFEYMVDNAFRGLTSKYKFKKVETKFEQRGCVVRYQNATTELALNYELGGKPWLTIGDVEKPENRSTLGWLLVELGVERAPSVEQAFHPVALADAELEAALQKMTADVQEHGVALLKGDFTLMPKLQARSRKYALDCKRVMAVRKAKNKK